MISPIPTYFAVDRSFWNLGSCLTGSPGLSAAVALRNGGPGSTQCCLALSSTHAVWTLDFLRQMGYLFECAALSKIRQLLPLVEMCLSKKKKCNSFPSLPQMYFCVLTDT